HVAEHLALSEPVERPLRAVEATLDLDRARVDHVRLAARVVALAEDDLAGPEAAPLDVAEREVLVDLEPDRGQGGLGLDREPGVRPAAEAALEDPHVLEAARAERQERDAKGRPRPGEGPRRWVLHLVLGLGE